MKKPKLASGFAQKEVDRLDDEFKAKAEQAASLTQDDLAKAPMKQEDVEPFRPKKEILEAPVPRIVPTFSRSPNGKKKPEQDSLRRRAWEYVKVICSNAEIPGEQIEFWHKPAISGEECNYWQIPADRPVLIPRHVAEHIKSRKYHRLKMQEEITVERSGMGEFKGKMVAEHTLQRLDCTPVGF